MSSEGSIQHWSTDEIPVSQRFEYFANALSTAIVPMRAERRGLEPFGATMTALDLGPVSVIHQTGTPHRSFRLARDMSSSGEH